MTALLYCGDAVETMRSLCRERSVQTVVTSPPYYGLRDYGMQGQLGLEPTLGEYVANLVSVFREVRRVLRDDGTVWLNLGDSYGGQSAGPQGATGDRADRSNPGRPERLRSQRSKQLLGVPWRVAFALQDDGWVLRSDIIWAKPNPMPESVRDRPTKAHEYVFLLTKQPSYYYDADAIKTPLTEPHREMIGRTTREGVDTNGGGQASGAMSQNVGGANARSVWTIPPKPYKGAHFAVMPEALVERCILAGTSSHGCCPECRAPWVRQVRKGEPELRAWSATGAGHVGQSGSREEGSTLKHYVPRDTTGWRMGCGCQVVQAGEETPVRKCLVLDPFVGSGTVCTVAQRLGRDSIGVDLNPDYLELARGRIG